MKSIPGGKNKQGRKSQEKSCFEKWFTMEQKHFKDTSTESKEQVGNKQKGCTNLLAYWWAQSLQSWQ